MRHRDLIGLFDKYGNCGQDTAEQFSQVHLTVAGGVFCRPLLLCCLRRCPSGARCPQRLMPAKAGLQTVLFEGLKLSKFRGFGLLSKGMTLKCIYPRAVGREFSVNWKKGHMCPMLRYVCCSVCRGQSCHATDSRLLPVAFHSLRTRPPWLLRPPCPRWQGPVPPKPASCPGLWRFDIS